MQDHAEVLYARIVRNPQWHAEQVRDELSWSPEELAAAIQRLAELNLLVESGTAPSGWTVLTPDSAVHKLLGQAMHNSVAVLNDMSDTRQAVATVVESFQPIHCRNVSQAQIEVLTGEAEVTTALEDAAHHARYRVLSLHPGKPLRPEMLQEGLDRDADVLRRGIEIRTIHLASTAAAPHVAGYLGKLAELGAKVRVAQLLPLRLIIVDHTLAFLAFPQSLTPPGDTVTAVRVRGEVLVGVFEDIFEHCWSSGTPLAPRCGPGSREAAEDADSAPELTSRQREVLQMLAAGMTDEAMSRKLGVSERTVGRQVAELITRLGGQSRFQAGFNAARRGWLEP
ncbi:helix-turn-helix transcriptional regulator [Streptomyces sp. NPDC041068]|uniref:helix-turn-helix transcriptional regulator n=1 Tax=Streptomyces sp. NPDC041068 TaxID=3155130 RepID=UPI0033C4C5D8